VHAPASPLGSGVRLSGQRSLECKPFEKLNISNRTRLGGVLKNDLPVLDLKIRSEYVWDGIWSENDHQISLERGSQCSQHCSQIVGTVCRTCLSTSNGLILDYRDTARSSRPVWWNSHWKTFAWWSWRENSGYIEQIYAWISSFDSWKTPCCLSYNVTVFA
jgi:hypothetical protein